MGRSELVDTATGSITFDLRRPKPITLVLFDPFEEQTDLFGAPFSRLYLGTRVVSLSIVL